MIPAVMVMNRKIIFSFSENLETIALRVVFAGIMYVSFLRVVPGELVRSIALNIRHSNIFISHYVKRGHLFWSER